MAEEDFEIDIYGDANGQQGNSGQSDSGHQQQEDYSAGDDSSHTITAHSDDYGLQAGSETQQQTSTASAQQPAVQGIKRKEGSDDRPVDPGATTAIMVSDLSWWITDDDIRGWLQSVQCEDELKDITFSEHKVNGKSKGQAYIEFTSQQATTAAKRKIESLATGEYQPGQKKLSVIYSSPTTNPFRTLPKEAPGRGVRDQQNRAPIGTGYQDRSNMNFNSGMGNNNGNQNFTNGGGYRGGRGGMYGGPRGGGMGNTGGFNRNFNGGGGGNMNAFNNNGMNFGNPMGGGGFGGGGGGFRGNIGGGMRGGPGMRGGRGGPMNGMMAGMGPAMGGMGPMGPMGGMPGPMGPMGAMGMVSGMPGFQGMHPNFAPNFFGGGGTGGGNQGGNDWQNPHGTKRPRPE